MRSTLLPCSFLLAGLLNAQTPLPYSTGFDNAAQQQGWQEFPKGITDTYDWVYTTSGAHSAPNQLWHDYNVEGAETDTVKDWFVSPALDLSAGATLEMQVNAYAIIGTPMAADRFKVYLLVGSSDPAHATTITELADLLDMVSNAGTWEAASPIEVPNTAGSNAHIAFYYQSSQNWFTPGIDDVSITATGAGVHELLSDVDVQLFPNPAADAFSVDVRDARYANEALRLKLFDARGALVMDRVLKGKTIVPNDQRSGRYTYVIDDARGALIKRGELVLAR